MSGLNPEMMSSTRSVAAMDSANISAQANNVPNPYTPTFTDRSIQVERSPGGFYFPADTPPENIAAMDLETQMAGEQAMAKQKSRNMFNPLMYGGQLLNMGQQQRPMQAMGQVRPAQQINLSDPISALLAPKRKKQEPLSLL